MFGISGMNLAKSFTQEITCSFTQGQSLRMFSGVTLPYLSQNGPSGGLGTGWIEVEGMAVTYGVEEVEAQLTVINAIEVADMRMKTNFLPGIYRVKYLLR